MSSISSIASTASIQSNYWCYRCNRFVSILPNESVSCPDCTDGFLEEVSSPPRLAAASRRRNRRNPTGDRSPFNPVIVLRGGTPDVDNSVTSNNSFELFYDDGAGSGLRPLPSTMSDFLMGSGFDRLLSQLAQIESNGGRGLENPPASKSAIESMPTVTIDTDSNCAICTEKFDFGSEAREMPCKHIYHQDCILPWLSLRNSCPVCRHELPSDVRRSNMEVDAEEESVGLTIWRLPGGGFAVGRFTGARRHGERELPVVYTEMDGGFNSGSGQAHPRRVSWGARGNRRRESGGIRQAIRNFFSFRCFGGSNSNVNANANAHVSSSTSSSSSRRSWRAPILRSTRSWSRSSSWALEDSNGR